MEQIEAAFELEDEEALEAYLAREDARWANREWPEW